MNSSRLEVLFLRLVECLLSSVRVQTGGYSDKVRRVVLSDLRGTLLDMKDELQDDKSKS